MIMQKTMLHILTTETIPECVAINNPQHGILLIRDAVYLLLHLPPNKLDTAKIYVLQDDFIARGLEKSNVATNIKLISYADFVNLIVEYKSNTTWT